MVKSKSTTKLKEVTKSLPVTGETDAVKWGPTVGLTAEAIKAFALLASSIMFAAPAFATQANPNNIIALADMFYNFATGSIKVQQPSDEAANPVQASTPTFG